MRVTRAGTAVLNSIPDSNPDTYPRGNPGLATKLRDYWILTKPEVNFLVLASAWAGFCLGSSTGVNLRLLCFTLLGTFLIASGTATLNQFIEREFDLAMRRTASRPLPAGRIVPWHACCFGAVISVAGGLVLWFAANPLASILAIFTLLSYLFAYTPLKRKTALCTAVGAVPGAMPPLIGWAAAHGSLSAGAWSLFAILFFWQFPHFLSIALLYRKDYERAGFCMLPEPDTQGRFTRLEILVFSLILLASSLIPAALGYGGRIYLLAALAAGGLFVVEAARFTLQGMSGGSAAARRVLHASVLYLPVVMFMLVFDTIW